jgi:hypothetical protein
MHTLEPPGPDRAGASRARPGLRTDRRATHRLLALQQTSGNAAVAGLVQRDESKTKQGPPKTRVECEKQLKERYGVKRVVVGTVDDEVSFLGPTIGSALKKEVDTGKTKFGRWDPESTPEVYGWLVDGFAGFAAALGGTPEVDDVFFFGSDFDLVGPAGSQTLESQPTAAKFGARQLGIFSVAANQATGKKLPSERDEPGKPALVPDARSSTGGRRIVEHELGHGFVEAAMGQAKAGPDPGIVADYAKAVGWVGGKLYDLTDEADAKASAAGQVPPSKRPIDEAHWQRPEKGAWSEQPLSGYMLAGPSEDLPEALMAFAEKPDVLKARSPHRYEFVVKHKESLQKAGKLRKPT